MLKQSEAIQALKSQRMLPLFYHDSAEVSIGIVRALYAGGIRMVEYTARGEKALENFVLLKNESKNWDGLLLGIGTIKTAAAAEAFVAADADFIVSPTINTEVGAVAKREGLLWIPGCMTPTEISVAEGVGAAIVKIFPGSLLGPSYISAIQELFPRLMFMPTGGVEVEKENLQSWFRSGVVAVGMGSKFITKEIMEEKDFKKLETATANALQLVREAAQ